MSLVYHRASMKTHGNAYALKEFQSRVNLVLRKESAVPSENTQEEKCKLSTNEKPNNY